MSAADPARSLVVWRLGDAVLALAVEQVVEVAPVVDGLARTRHGDLPPVGPPGLPPGPGAARAVIVNTPAGPVAVAADAVEGVHPGGVDRTELPPRWLHGLDTGAIRSLVRLRDRRLAVLLDPAALEGTGAT